MWPITDGCKTALKSSHTRTPVVEIFDGFGSMIASSYSTPRVKFDNTAQIRVDRTAKHVRMFTGNVLDPSGVLAARIDQPILDPLRRPQMAVYFDIGWNDPATGVAHIERIPVGRFVLTRAKGTEIGAGEQIAVEGTSAASMLIEQNPWLAPYNVPSSVGYDAAIRAALVERTLPGWAQTFRFETSLHDTPIGVILGGTGASDPWSDLTQMAVTDGKELFDDQVGAFVLRTPPVAAGTPPVWAYDESPTSPRLRGTTKRDTDATTAYNGVVLTASAPWLLVPVSAIVWDQDPTSPTYYLGPFGKRPYFFDDVASATPEQANAAATAKFNDVTGVTEQIDLEGLPNPAHDPGDIVTVVSAGTGLADPALLQAFTLSFDVTSSMPATLQRKRTR